MLWHAAGNLKHRQMLGDNPSIDFDPDRDFDPDIDFNPDMDLLLRCSWALGRRGG